MTTDCISTVLMMPVALHFPLCNWIRSIQWGSVVVQIAEGGDTKRVEIIRSNCKGETVIERN